MSVELKDKTKDAASKMLKSTDNPDKLHSADNGNTLKAGLRETFDLYDASSRKRARDYAEELHSENLSMASDVLLGTKEDITISIADRELGGGKLYTASVRRAKAEALREGRESSLLEGLDDANAKKLRDNRKKMQSKLRKNFEVKSDVKGGLVTDLRIEDTVQGKLTDTPKHRPSDLADSIGKRALHFLDDISEGDDNSTQNAWIDTLDKGAEGASSIYSISETAKYWRRSKREADIIRLSRRQDKFIRDSYRLQYKSALKTAKESELWKNSSLYEKSLQKKLIKRKYMKNAIAEYRKAKKAGSTGRVTYTTGLNVFDKAKASARTLGRHILTFAKSPAGKIAISVILVVGLFISLITTAGPMLLMSFGGDDDYVNSQRQTTGGFPATVEQWRTFVTERMNEYGYPDFVNAILATIEQESAGISLSCNGDLMQSRASGYWTSGTPTGWSSYTTEQKSIDAGCRYFIEGLKKWNVSQSDDYDGLQIVAQGYNYGWAFLDYMKTNNAKKWTLSLSTAYSNKMALQVGWTSYGHTTYGEEWLKKYKSGGVFGGGAVVAEKGPGGVVKTAQGQIGITENPAGSNTVVYNTEYYGYEVSGDAYPWCCVFVWWCFNKSGNADAFYDGGKVAGCSSVHTWAQNGGYIINGSEAQYGDLVLFSTDEHIEIVVANNGDGSYTTIGGNTSSGDGASQSNGGGVFMRTRYTSGEFPITLFIRPPYSKEKSK